MTKKKHAWLFAWEASTDDRLAGIRGSRFLAFIDYRRSRAAIRDMIFAIYLSSNELLPREKLSFALSPELRRKMQKEDASSLWCGFNPWVVARQVDEVEIETLDSGPSIVRWKQPIYRFSKGYLQPSGFVQREEKIQE